MVEFGRFAQIEGLKAKGWSVDDFCLRLNAADGESVGGPEHMLGPDGHYYACSCGVETPLSGISRFWHGPLPENYDDYTRRRGDNGVIRSVVFSNGVMHASQG